MFWNYNVSVLCFLIDVLVIFMFSLKLFIRKLLVLYVQDLRLPYVVSIDFWQYKVEVEVFESSYFGLFLIPF